MLLFYLDEFGDQSLRRSKNASGKWELDPRVAKWFVLGALGISETSRVDLAEDIIEIKDRYFSGWRTREWKHTEIKGRYLRDAHTKISAGKLPSRPAFAHLTAPQIDRLCTELGGLLAKFRPFAYVIAIDKEALARKAKAWPAVEVAYAFLQQRIALLVDEVFGDAEGALMIADDQQAHESLFRSGAILAVRAEITKNLPKQPRFDLIIDRPVWIDPNLHPLDREILQLADILCYAGGTVVVTGKEPTSAAHMWTRVRPCLATHWTSGLIADGGFSIYPRPSGYPANLGS